MTREERDLDAIFRRGVLVQFGARQGRGYVAKAGEVVLGVVAERDVVAVPLHRFPDVRQDGTITVDGVAYTVGNHGPRGDGKVVHVELIGRG